MGQNYSSMLPAPSWKRVSVEGQLGFLLHLGLSKCRNVVIIHRQCCGSHFIRNSTWRICYLIMKLLVNGASTIFCLVFCIYQCCMLSNQLITELFTTCIAKYILYNMIPTESKLIDIASCTACKQVLLVVEQAIQIRYYYQTTEWSALCESVDWAAGRPADNLPKSSRLGFCHQTVPTLTVLVYWQPGNPHCQGFGS